MTGNLWVDAVPEKVAEWKKYVAAIEAEKQELRPGEDEAFYGLRDYWKNGDFNPANCKKLIDIIKREANFHPNGWENMLLFLRLCVDYYTRNKDAFVAFQRALGGKQPRTTPQPPPPPPTRPQPVPPPPQRPTPPPPPRPPQPPRHNPPPQPPPEQRITFSDGYYVGDIQNGRATGVGKRYFTDAERRGSWQQGSFINGLLHGTNCVSYWAKSGRTDRGEYRNGVRAGKGRIEWSDGEVYEGEWNENGRHGLGIDRFPQQNYVERGIWSNDRRYLKGRMEWGNGNWYEGQWNENGRHGNGTHYWAANKRTDTGQYQNDVRKGKGVSKWANGNRYEGSWDDSSGQLNGEGVYYYADGRREKCRYVNGTYQVLGSSKPLGGIGGWIWRSIPWWPIVAAAVCTVCLLFTDRVGKALIIGALALLGAGALYFFLEWAQGQLEKVREWFIKWPRWLRVAFWIVVTGLIIKLIFVYKPHISLARMWLSGANRTEEIIRPESALAGTWTGVFNRENTTLIITEGDSSRFTAAISVGTNPVRQLHVALSDYPSVHLAPEQTQGNYSGEWNGAVQADTLFAGDYHNPRTGSKLPFSFIKKQSF